MTVDTTSAANTTYAIVKQAKYWTAYTLYFGMDNGDQDKTWAPHAICSICRTNLKDGCEVPKNVSHLQFLECGENLQIIMMIAIFV